MSKHEGSGPVVRASKSVWYGDKKDGIEVRYQDDELDEVVMYSGGTCIFHLEQMSDTCFWMALYSKKKRVDVNVFSKNGRAWLAANADES